MKIKMKILAIPVCLALMTTSAHSALLITVTGDANGSGSMWVFNGTSVSTAGGEISGGLISPLVNRWSHGSGELSGEYVADNKYDDFDVVADVLSGSVAGSVSGSFLFDTLRLDSDSSMGSDDFTWMIGSQSPHTIVKDETITYSNYTLQTNLDITTFGEGANAITTNGDSFTVGSTTERIGDLTLTFTAQVVPEPSSSALHGLGGLSLLIRRRR